MSMFPVVYNLPISPEYVRSWGVAEAVRELLQNAIDSDSPFEWSFDCSTLMIRSAGVQLSPRSLLLGTTTKSKGDKIGCHGEGFKVALLVLCREGRRTIVRNGPKLWLTSFEYVKKYDSNMLTITELDNSDPDAGLIFEIHDLTTEEIHKITDNCLHMQDDPGDSHQTNYGSILLDPKHSGKLYVGGLFICETELTHGYDIKPGHIALERDRQTVSGFDLKFMTKNMWFETGNNDTIADMIERGVPDLEYASYSTPLLVKEACYRLFQQKYPGHIAAESQKQLQELVERGMTKVIMCDSSTFRSIVASEPRNMKVVLESAMTPAMVLREFYKTNKGTMGRVASIAFKKLIQEANKWKA